jgi:aminopeptidase N
MQYLSAQLMQAKPNFTKADTLRGSNNDNRNWWNVLHYDIELNPNIANKTIQGKVTITYNSELEQRNGMLMQIDLQQPLQIQAVFCNNQAATFTKSEGETWLITIVNASTKKGKKGFTDEVTIVYSGKPKEAVRPPWDGGFIWRKDKNGSPFVSVACQGLGASVWYPCKDIQSDEPDNGATLTIIAPDSLVAVANGKKILTVKDTGYIATTWQVKNPINNYNIVPYIGKYEQFADTIKGEAGVLQLQFFALNYNIAKAKEQFKQAKTMLHCFEHWFGKYPFYEDGFKLVEAPHLGMEHQSAIAYGNNYLNGYRGTDLSGTGWGTKWDFIIVHESGHEWFANNITTNDIADMWVHEGFTNYSETLYTEWLFGKQAGNEYCKGIRKNIQNDKPIIGYYGVNKEGSGDMYYKAANMIHLIRNSINDDVLFRNILRGLNSQFFYQTVSTEQVETFINEKSGIDFSPVFKQYLRTTQIPELQLYTDSIAQKLYYRFANCIDNFTVKICLPNSTNYLQPTTKWQSTNLEKTTHFTKENIEALYYFIVQPLTAKPQE